MKVLAVNPGYVSYSMDEKHWYYTVSYQQPTPAKLLFKQSNAIFESAVAAKQAMREKVFHERKRHGLLEE